MEKNCYICKTNKPLSDFSPKSGRTNQFTSYCKQCWKIKRQMYYSKQKLREYKAGTRKLSTTRGIHLDRASFKSEAEWRTAYQNAYNKQRANTDLNFKLTLRLRSRLNKALAGHYKTGSAIGDLGCSVEELKAYLESQFKEGMTWANHGEWHIDHIRPLSSFDLSDPEQVRIACNYTNLQPLWAEENLKKGNTYV